MPLKAVRWFNRLGLNTRILLLAGLPLAATAAITTFVVHWSTQRFVENAIGDQMVMEARIVAHLVAIAEQQRPEGMTPAEIPPANRSATSTASVPARRASAPMNSYFAYSTSDAACSQAPAIWSHARATWSR